MRSLCLALVVGLAAACTGDKRPEVSRITIQPVPQTPSARRFPALTLENGEGFQRFRRLLPRPLPAPVPHRLPELTEETATRACVSLRLEIEFSSGETVGYDECSLPRALEPPCAALSRVVPPAYRCTRRLRPLMSIATGIEPRLGRSDIARVVERELGRGSRLELVAAVPNDLVACRFVGGCSPPRRGPVPRWAWFVVAYQGEAEKTVVSPTYLVIEDRSGAVLGTRADD